MSKTVAIFVGIDVFKEALDLAVRPFGATSRFSNDEAGVVALVGEMKR